MATQQEDTALPMRPFPVSQLREGLEFTQPVYSNADVMFVPANKPIKKRELDQLAALGVKEVLTAGVPKPPATGDAAKAAPAAGTVPATGDAAKVAPATGDAAKTVPSGAPSSAAGADAPQELTQPSVSNPGEKHAKLVTLIVQLDKIFQDIASGVTKSPAGRGINPNIGLSIRQLWNITAALINITKESRSEALGFILCGQPDEHFLAKSSINTAILACVTGAAMGYTNEKITAVTASALLHDVGMLRLPAEIVNKTGDLSTSELAVIQSHTALSYQIIRSEFMYGDEVAISVLQHHERWDGTGYPHRLAGHAISVDASIICIADAFEAMVCEKPYRKQMTGYNAMRALVSSNMAHFSPDVLKVFVKVMGIYPIGSGVALNDGRLALVIDFTGGVPLRPKVKIIALQGAKKVKDGEIVDLTVQRNIYIVQAVDIKGF